MATDGESDLAGFHQFVGEELANANSDLSLEQALTMWRHRQEEIEAIREGFRAVEEGRTMSLDEHLSRIRERHPSLEDV